MQFKKRNRSNSRERDKEEADEKKYRRDRDRFDESSTFNRHRASQYDDKIGKTIDKLEDDAAILVAIEIKKKAEEELNAYISSDKFRLS